MTENEKQEVIHALETLSKHRTIMGCKECAKTAEFALQLIKEQEKEIENWIEAYQEY